MTQLRLDDNRIDTVHANLGNLTNLTTLWLSTNQISDLPEEMNQLVALHTIYLMR